jgi:hypothetical protein
MLRILLVPSNASTAGRDTSTTRGEQSTKVASYYIYTNNKYLFYYIKLPMKINVKRYIMKM